MDPQTVFCPNIACPARGQVGKGNISVHSQEERRYKCRVCNKTFAETKGTVFYRLRTSQDIVVTVVTLLAYGCPVQAVVAAFGLDERTVQSWQSRSGKHCQQVHEHLVEQPRDLGQVQADEIRVKMQGLIVWMAMAIQVQTRLWLGGVVSPSRDKHLMRALMQRVCRCALCRSLLFCTAYIERLNATFRSRIATLVRRGRALARQISTLEAAREAIKSCERTHRSVVRLTTVRCGATTQKGM